MKVLNFGSLNLDKVYTVEHFVRAGETLSSSRLEEFCGGKGLNQSIAFARAGATVFMPDVSARTAKNCAGCLPTITWIQLSSE